MSKKILSFPTRKASWGTWWEANVAVELPGMEKTLEDNPELADELQDIVRRQQALEAQKASLAERLIAADPVYAPDEVTFNERIDILVESLSIDMEADAVDFAGNYRDGM